MQLIDGTPVYSATDLVGFLACEHLTNLERAALAGLVERPNRADPELDRIAQRGLQHEHRFLEALRADGCTIAEIAPDESIPDRGARLRDQASRTLAAMRGGVDVVYQATFLEGPAADGTSPVAHWLGFADFLRRVETPSDLGSWSYEAWDTKLARHTKASAILQLCLYTDLLERLQGCRPAQMHVALGGGRHAVDHLRTADYLAYYRLVRARFEAFVGASIPAYPPLTRPDPVEHCEVCRWQVECATWRRRHDDLSLVASITAKQRRALREHEPPIPTRRALAATTLPLDPPLPRTAGVREEGLRTVRDQARLQVEGEEAGRTLYELLPPTRLRDGTLEPDRGLLSLPQPSPGDLFFDIEGDPFALEDGVDYLFGVIEPGPAATNAPGLAATSTPGPAATNAPAPAATNAPGLSTANDPSLRATDLGLPATGRPGLPATHLPGRRDHLPPASGTDAATGTDAASGTDAATSTNAPPSTDAATSADTVNPRTAHEPTFHAIWSIDADGQVTLAAEKAAFEQLVDLIVDRRSRDPNMHVYHYAAYEPTAMGRLSERHATREAEVDDLLRNDVFVDLFRAVRQGLRASVESYSIKKIEALYGFVREEGLRDAGSSIVEFETWLELGTDEAAHGPEILDRIARYNRDDCVSNRRLRDWLEERRPELAAAIHVAPPDLPRPVPGAAEPGERLTDYLAQVHALEERLVAGMTDAQLADPAVRTPEQHARWLLAQLLSWHRREDKSTWWRYFHLLDLTDEERIAETDALAGLEYAGEVAQEKRSIVHRYRFPPQEHDIDPGTTVIDPATRRSPGTVVAVDNRAGTIDLRRAVASEVPHPTSLVPREIVDTPEQRASLLRVGDWVAEHGIDADGAYRALRDLLLRRPPRLRGGAPLHVPREPGAGAARRLAPLLDQSYLAVQGPPG